MAQGDIVPAQKNEVLNRRFLDNGDGTYSEIISVGGSSGAGTGASAPQSQGAIASGANNAGNPVKEGLVYNATEPTVSSGQIVDAQSDNRGNQLMNLASRLDPTNDAVVALPFGDAYAAISTATTTVIKTGSGVLHSITIAGGTAGAITIYDNTAASGTTIIPAFTPGSVATPVTIILDEAFTTGLTILTAAATVLNVSYR